jgi:hypothetical protein
MTDAGAGSSPQIRQEVLRAGGVDLLCGVEAHERVAVSVDLAASGDRHVLDVLGIREADHPVAELVVAELGAALEHGARLQVEIDVAAEAQGAAHEDAPGDDDRHTTSAGGRVPALHG